MQNNLQQFFFHQSTHFIETKMLYIAIYFKAPLILSHRSLLLRTPEFKPHSLTKHT